MKAPSVLDVAREAGVSPSTVSRALNGTGEIAGDTRRRILEACEALGYSRNLAATALRGRQSQTVAAIMPDQEHERFIEKVHALREATQAAGFDWRLASYRDEDEAKRLILEIIGSRPSAMILSGTVPQIGIRERISSQGIASVLFDGKAEGWDSVALDRESGSEEAVGYLLDHGKRRILLLGAPLGSERGRGWQKAHATREIPADPSLVWDRPYPRNLHRWGLEQGREIASERGIDGVFCVNDAAALGVLRALHDAGRAVPHDVAVIGLDGIMACEVSVPSLSTVEQPCEAMASACVELLLRRRREMNAPVEHRLHKPILRLRESVPGSSPS
jgi:LacI family transcriptional regulator